MIFASTGSDTSYLNVVTLPIAEYEPTTLALFGLGILGLLPLPKRRGATAVNMWPTYAGFWSTLSRP